MGRSSAEWVGGMPKWVGQIPKGLRGCADTVQYGPCSLAYRTFRPQMVRNLTVSKILHDRLVRLDPQFPACEEGLENIAIK